IELLQAMPEYKAADSSLQAFQKTLSESYNMMNDEYQKKLNDFNNLAANTPAPVKEAKQQELVDMQVRIQKFESSAQDQIQDEKTKLYTPILKKAEDAVKAVAKES